MTKTMENQEKIIIPTKTQLLTPQEKEDLISQYSYLVKYMAAQMIRKLPSSISVDELVSAGNVGLVDAINKFDKAKNVDIKVYAKYRIRGAILDELRSMDWYSRTMRKKITSIEQAVLKVESRKKKAASDEEVAKELGISYEEHCKNLSEINRTSLLDLDVAIHNAQGTSSITFKDQLFNEEHNPENEIKKKELKESLIKAIKSLNEKEQMVISLYYFDEMTLKEIGQILDLTESRICQIHTLGIIKLKSKFKNNLI